MYDASVARDGSVQRSRSVGSAVFLSVEASARHKFRSELRRPSSWPPVPRNHGKAIEDVIALGDARERLIASTRTSASCVQARNLQSRDASRISRPDLPERCQFCRIARISHGARRVCEQLVRNERQMWPSKRQDLSHRPAGR